MGHELEARRPRHDGERNGSAATALDSRINLSKIGNIAVVGIGILGSLSTFIATFFTQNEVRGWLASIAPHVTPHALAVATQIVLAIVATYAGVLALRRDRRATLLASRVEVLNAEVDQRDRNLLDIQKRLSDATNPDPSKCKPRIERVELATTSQTRGLVTVSVSLPWPFGRGLTISSADLDYWRFDGRQIEAAHVKMRGVGTTVGPGGIVTFEISLFDDEMNALFAALRTLQNSRGTDISGFFAYGVTTVHTVGFAGALVLLDDGKPVRLALPAEMFDLATLVLNNVKNPYPPQRDVTPSVKAPLQRTEGVEYQIER
jgi:hypothetical protein